MIDIASVTIGFVLLLGAMTLGLHIATVMFGVGFIGAALYLGWPGANALVVVYLGSMDESVLLQLPLFILLGEILVRCPVGSCTPTLRHRPCSRPCPGRRWRPRPPSPPLPCRRSGRRTTTPAWSWARLPPVGRWAISSRPASP